MVNDLVFLNANIPMYAAGAEHPLKQPCVAILEEIAKGSLRAVTNVEVVQEILHRYTALGQRAKAVEVARLFLQIVPDALPITKAELLLALDLHTRYPALAARDTIHLAVMQQHGLTRIASADRHFDNLPGIIRLDPALWQVQDS